MSQDTCLCFVFTYADFRKEYLGYKIFYVNQTRPDCAFFCALAGSGVYSGIFGGRICAEKVIPDVRSYL